MEFSLCGSRTVRVPNRMTRGGAPDRQRRRKISRPASDRTPAFFKAAEAHGLEGIVSKRADSKYRSGRTDAWLKIKSFTVGNFAVLGFEKSSTGIPVALLATLGRDPTYVGNSTVKLPTKERETFWRSVEKMATPRARLAGLAKNKKATWIREGLVARVRHLRGEEKLRHATMQPLDVSEPLVHDVVERHPDGD